MHTTSQGNNNNNSNMSVGMSQSVHSGMQQANSFHNEQLQSASMHTTSQGSPPSEGLQHPGNVSIASDNVNSKGSPPAGAPLSEAMEKLCESMRRSAMSRNLVKQLSGRSLVKQGSARQLPSRNNSGALMRQGSQRGLTKQGSQRSLMDDGSGRGPGTPAAAVPIRRVSNTKHHMQHAGRGLHRHNSNQNLGGQSNHGINLQVDGRNVGTL
jgi:hypothetical protein